MYNRVDKIIKNAYNILYFINHSYRIILPYHIAICQVFMINLV